MPAPIDPLAELVRDALGHAVWQRDSGESQVLTPRAVGSLERPKPPAPPKPPERPKPPVSAPTPKMSSLAQPAIARAPERPPIAGTGAEGLARVQAVLGDCQRCKLCKTRTNIVFGVGNPRARVVFVGEGPGENEDRQGEPFVGAAGALLDKMIVAMGLGREQVYICNVVKCRPPNNRNPEPDELAACQRFLHGQLDSIAPEVIVALGKFAAQTLLQSATPISRLRGQWHSYRGVKLMPTFHPSYLLRTPSEKGKAWADLQEVMKVLGLTKAR